MTGPALVVDALAAYRLTRLVIEDTITDDIRERIRDAARRELDTPGAAAKIGKLLDCPWCAGFWVSLGVVVARTLAPRAWSPVARVLAVSAAVGLIATKAEG